jgi:hypothetical protein
LIYQLLKNAGSEAKDNFLKLLKGEEVEIGLEKSIVYDDLKTQTTSIWSLILFTGYLTLKTIKPGSSIFSVKIPNEEVRLSLAKLLKKWLAYDFGSQNLYIDTINLFINNDINSFEDTLNSKFLIFFSYSDKGPSKKSEAFFHGFLFCLSLILMEVYEVCSNIKFGHGDPDLVFYRKDRKGPGFILECKIADDEKGVEVKMNEAKSQVLEKNYSFGFKKLGISEYRVYGIVFQNDKTKCRIQLLEENPSQTF